MTDETTALIAESRRLENDYGDGHEVKEHMLDVTDALVAAERALDAIAAVFEAVDVNTVEASLADIETLINASGRSRSAYPALIVVFCDRCLVEESSDFLVRDTDSSLTRLGYARARAAKLGWFIDPDIDLCPMCASAEAEAVR